MNLDALVAPLRADVVSGAAAVARTAADVVRRGTARALPDASPEAFREGLVELVVRILDAQPAMAPLVNLGCAVLDAERGATTVEEARQRVARTAAAFRSILEEGPREAGRRVLEHLPEEGTVLTLSSSSSVRAALVAAGEERRLRVICLEARPMNEGRSLARALAEAGLEVLYAVDAALGSLIPEADAVLIGADSVGDAGVVNKIGSLAAARAARDHDVPVLVAADRTKLLPMGFPQPIEDDRPGEEVWSPSETVRVWNRYFERVPLDLVDLVVTDRAALTPAAIPEIRQALEVPPELVAWADGRRSGQEPHPSSGV